MKIMIDKGYGWPVEEYDVNRIQWEYDFLVLYMENGESLKIYSDNVKQIINGDWK